MKFTRLWRSRLALALLGDRMGGAVVSGRHAHVFAVDAEDPPAALRADLEARGLRPRTVALGLSRAAVTVKPIDLPPVVAEVRDIVRFELERHLPFPADDAAFDLLEPPADRAAAPAAGARRVLVVAADRRVVDAALKLAEDAKLRPVSLTVAAHDLLTLVRLDRRRRLVWAHRAGDAVDVLFVAGGTLASSRSLVADDALLAGEVRRTLVGLRWTEVDDVWASGDRAAELGEALESLEVTPTSPRYTRQAQQWLDGIAEEPRGALELALAVASRRGAPPLDLLPPALKPRRISRAQAITAGMAAAAAVLLVGALLVPGVREQRRLGLLNTEIKRLEPETREAERLLREVERKRRLLATVDSLETTAIRPLPVLRDLTEILPSEAWLTSLTLETKGIELTGQAATASTLIPLLENSPRLERVEFASPVTRGRDREQFRIRAAWEGGAGPPAPPAPATPPRRPGPGGPSR